MNELAMRNTSIVKNVDDLSRIGKMMADSGYFTDARQAAQAGVKVLAGQEMGFGAFASMTGIYIIQGKPSVGANLMASAVKANPKYDYTVKEISGKICKIEFYELKNGKMESIGVSEFTIEEARTAGVKNLDKYARNMLFARAMSNGIRWFCPDVFAGNVTYTPEELGAEVDGEGNVIDATIVETPVVEARIENKPVSAEDPTNNTPKAENAVEAAQKSIFDEIGFLRNWKHRAGLPPMTLAEACQMKDSKGKEYGTMSVERIYYMLNAIEKKIPTVSGEAKDAYMFKLSAINEILSAKADAQAQLDMPKDPFIKGE